MKLFVFHFAAIFFSFSVAWGGDFADAKAQYKDSPQKKDSETTWLEPYDPTYLPYGVCNEPSSIIATKMEEKVESYWDDANGFWEIITQDHGYCLFSIIKISYNVTCLNKLQYPGVKYFFSDNKCLKSGWTHGNFSKEEKDFLKNAHDWREISLDSLKSDDSIASIKTSFKTWNFKQKFNKEDLTEQWKEQRVAYPEWKYVGVPGKKLSRPVIFVHGLDSDFEVWGVKSTSNSKGAEKKISEEFQQGLVKKYERGSAPDILARTQNIDNTEANINHNGIYFFQAPGTIRNGEWDEAKPFWDNGNETNSQSRKLYKFLGEVLDDFCSGTQIDWRQTPELMVDIVAHSQGGLVVREMLRGLRADKASSGSENPANHIGKLITVNTPHFGSELASTDTESLNSTQYGLKLLIDDLDSIAEGDSTSHSLVTASVDAEFYKTFVSQVTTQFINWGDSLVSKDNPLALITGIFVTPTAAILGFLFGSATYPFTDLNLGMTGPYIGKYDVRITPDVPLAGEQDPIEFSIASLGSIDLEKDVQQRAIQTRQKGSHLAPQSKFIEALTRNTIDNTPYPIRPDSTLINFLPLYSPSVKRMFSDILHSLSEEANRICLKAVDDEGCFAAGAWFEKTALKMAPSDDYKLNGLENVEFSDDFWNILVSLQDDWLAASDGLVSDSSQKFINEAIKLSPDNIVEFEKPRNYIFHDALAPWEDVLHVAFQGMNAASAPRQGLDIACALNFHCDNLLVKDAKIIYLENGKVDLTGDFEVTTLYLQTGLQGMEIADENSHLKASYLPGKGSFIHYTDGNGAEQEILLLNEKIPTAPSLSRTGNEITATFNNYSGKIFSKRIALPNLSSNATLSIISEDDGSIPKVAVGFGTPTNPNSQQPPELPLNHLRKKSKIFALHREARESHEKNTSRPRILVGNTSNSDIKGFKVAYYFSADPAREPKVEIDYPKIPVKLENLGGDQWRFVLDASDSTLKAQSVFPSLDGWQIRIHYSDWSNYKHLDDWSADYNLGYPKANQKIVIYDAEENILWGKEPDAYKSTDEGLIASPKGVLSWHDSSPWETNAFKPLVSIKNTGAVPLKNYYAKLWFRTPVGKELYIPVDDWYTPVSKPSLFNLGENVWELDVFFNLYLLYPGNSVSEGDIELHLTDWSAFDKTVCGIALTDSDGNVIYGKIPTVAECKSYDSPDHLNTRYVWRF